MDGTLIGSHLAPTFQCAWDIPEDAISGGATFMRESARLNLHTPSVDMDVHLDTKFPPFEVVLQARTQQEAEQAAMPIIEGLAIDCSLHGCVRCCSPVDVSPFLRRAVRSPRFG